MHKIYTSLLVSMLLMSCSDSSNNSSTPPNSNETPNGACCYQDTFLGAGWGDVSGWIGRKFGNGGLGGQCQLNNYANQNECVTYGLTPGLSDIRFQDGSFLSQHNAGGPAGTVWGKSSISDVKPIGLVPSTCVQMAINYCQNNDGTDYLLNALSPDGDANKLQFSCGKKGTVVYLSSDCSSGQVTTVSTAS